MLHIYEISTEVVKYLMEQKPQVRILHHLCEVLLVVPRSTGNPLMDLTSVPDNNA